MNDKVFMLAITAKLLGEGRSVVGWPGGKKFP